MAWPNSREKVLARRGLLPARRRALRVNGQEELGCWWLEESTVQEGWKELEPSQGYSTRLAAIREAKRLAIESGADYAGEASL